MNALSMDLSTSTDDRPFFFNELRFRDLLRTETWRNRTRLYNLEALSVLVALMVVVLVLTIGCILVPLRRVPIENARTFVAGAATYFAAIGLGYMFIEMAQMQMLTMFLGHPTYSLGVVLSTLLISSGVGSSLTARSSPGAGRVQLAILMATLVAFAMLSPALLHSQGAARMPVRIAISMALVAPLGLFMGMPLPLGMRFAASQSKGAAAWLWGINGAMSVCGSVAAMILALMFGISVMAWLGAAAYAVAAVAFWRFAPADVVRQPEPAKALR
jgi:hypothetical protein